MNPAKQIFILYDSQDAEYVDALERQLSILKNNGKISSWNIGEVEAGSNTENEIRQKLQLADIVILLVSSYYFVSELCMKIQSEAFRQRKYIIPIVVRPCTWYNDKVLKTLEALPKKKQRVKAVSTWKNKDKAFELIAREIDKVTDKIIAQSLREDTMLKEAFLELDFIIPTQRFKKYIEVERALNISLIRGTQFCGHNILLERFKRMVSNWKDTQNPAYVRPIPFNLPKIASSEDMWLTIYEEFQLVEGYNIHRTSQEIYKRLFTENIIIHLEGLEYFTASENIAMIGKFWNELALELQKLIKTTPPPNRLFLFILEKSEEKTYSYNVKNFKLYTNNPLSSPLLELSIEPISKQDIYTWYILKAGKFSRRFNYIEEYCECMTSDEKVFILNAIEEICRKIKLYSVYSKLKKFT